MKVKSIAKRSSAVITRVIDSSKEVHGVLAIIDYTKTYTNENHVYSSWVLAPVDILNRTVDFIAPYDSKTITIYVK